MILNISDISDWEFKEANLVRHYNGDLVPSGDEGLLYVTIVNHKTGDEKSGTVCSTTSFNVHTAGVFCQHMGYNVKEPYLGINLQVNKYVPE